MLILANYIHVIRPRHYRGASIPNLFNGYVQGITHQPYIQTEIRYDNDPRRDIIIVWYDDKIYTIEMYRVTFGFHSTDNLMSYSKSTYIWRVAINWDRSGNLQTYNLTDSKNPSGIEINWYPNGNLESLWDWDRERLFSWNNTGKFLGIERSD